MGTPRHPDVVRRTVRGDNRTLRPTVGTEGGRREGGGVSHGSSTPDRETLVTRPVSPGRRGRRRSSFSPRGDAAGSKIPVETTGVSRGKVFTLLR